MRDVIKTLSTSTEYDELVTVFYRNCGLRRYDTRPMPPLEKWNHRPAIKLLMTAKKRNDHSNVIERKATRAPYFDGIFEAVDEEESGSVIEQNNVAKKF